MYIQVLFRKHYQNHKDVFIPGAKVLREISRIQPEDGSWKMQRTKTFSSLCTNFSILNLQIQAQPVQSRRDHNTTLFLVFLLFCFLTIIIPTWSERGMSYISICPCMHAWSVYYSE